MRRKAMLTLLFALIMVMSTISAYAVTPQVSVNGQPVVFADQTPVVVDGRTLVPVAGVFQTLGFDVQWNGDTQQATLSRAGQTVVITVGSNTFTTNGASHTLDVPAQLIGGRTMLPIAAVLRSVGYDVNWAEATNTVTITQPAAAVVPPVQVVPQPPAAPQPPPQEPAQEPQPEPVTEPAPAAGADLARTVWLPQTRNFIYHSINDCGRMNPANATSITRGAAQDMGYRACERCW